MSLHADFDLKERVRAAVDIVDVIGQTLELRPQGRNFVGLCPFHADKRPSFTVNPARQSWKCWPCDRGGDVFSFVQQRDGVSFPEALRTLAERAGIEMPTHGGPPVEPGGPRDKATLLAAMKFAVTAFSECLQNPDSKEAAAARAYMAKRGINEESRQQFQIGYAPDDFKWLVSKGVEAGFSHEVLEAAGLALRKDTNRPPYSRFRGRLIFPIFDLQDRAISAGGRVLPSDDPQKSGGAKYINGPETLLFSKSHQLYGLNLARPAVMQSREILVMEGYTDVIAARQAGIEPVVAVLGTALGEGHLRIIKRFADRVVLVLDGDDAGRRRADEVLELFIHADLDLRVLTLPDNSDPADFIQAEGREVFEKKVAEAPDAIEHKLATLLNGVDVTTDTHRATAAMETMLSILAKAPSRQGDLRGEQILLRLSRVFSTSKELLAARLKQLRLEQSKRKRYRSSQASTETPGKASPVKPVSQSRSVAPAPRSMPQDFDPNNAFLELGSDEFGEGGFGEEPIGFGTAMPVAPSYSSGHSSNYSSQPSVSPEKPKWEPIVGIDRELFEILIEEPQWAPLAIEAIAPDDLQTESAREILAAYQELDLAGRDLDVQSLLSMVEVEPLRKMIVTMDENVKKRVGELTRTPEQRYHDVQDRYQQKQWNVKRQQHIQSLRSNEMSADAETKLLQDLFEGEKARKGLLYRPVVEPVKSAAASTQPPSQQTASGSTESEAPE